MDVSEIRARYGLKEPPTLRKKFTDRRNTQDIRYHLMLLVCPIEDTNHIKCVECGYDNIRALQFDHKNNDGNIDRRRFKSHNALMNYYLKHPEEAQKNLQILCANCNWLKRDDNYE